MSTVDIKKLEKSKVELTVSVPAEEFEPFRKAALTNMKKVVEIDGFRKGQAPDAIVIQKVGEGALLQEAAQEAVSSLYPTLVKEHKIDAIGRPDITITKLAPGNPLEFKAVTSTLPDITLPDYKGIAQKITSKKEDVIEVKDEEVNEFFKNVRMQHEQMEQLKKAQEEKGDSPADKEVSTKEEKKLTDDEFAKSIGKFENADALKKKIKEDLLTRKTQEAKDKKRMEILEGILEKTKFDTPEVLIELEKEKMLEEMKNSVQNSGMKFEDYLSHIKKEEADLKKEWEEPATKRARINLLLESIIKNEKIVPDPKKVEEGIQQITSMHPTADKNRVKVYLEDINMYEQVYALLENTK